jgi:hypothetical protein
VFDPVKTALVKSSVKEMTFRPSFFDSPNKMTPNQEMVLASQRAIEKIRPIFKKHGFKIGSRQTALMVLNESLKHREPFAQELDQALAGAYREMGIAEIARRRFPATLDDFFADLTIATAILLGQIGQDEARRLLAFYETQLAVAERTLQERQSLVIAARSYVFFYGSEALRQHLAAEWDIESIGRKYFETTERARSVLQIFVDHQGSLCDLEELYKSLLFGDLASLLMS